MLREVKSMLARVFIYGNGQRHRLNKLRKDVNGLQDQFEVIFRAVVAWRSSISQVGPLKEIDKVRMCIFSFSYVYLLSVLYMWSMEINTFIILTM